MEKPDYHGARDEITRSHIESAFTEKIKLKACVCGVVPHEMFRSDTAHFVGCPRCRRQTKEYRHLYEAKQAWNKMMSEEAEKMRKTTDHGNNVEKGAFTTKGLCAFRDCGRPAAVAFGEAAKAKIKIGRSVRWNRAKIEAAMDAGLVVESTKREGATA